MQHPLTDAYGDSRERLIELGTTISAAEAAAMCPACPEWSVKDVYAHLAGISTDILAGNTAEAATPAWADGHVEQRSAVDLAGVIAEWRDAGAEVSAIMASVGDAFPLELFVDQWTHEWDIRSALGQRAAAEADLRIYEHYLVGFFDRIENALADTSAAALELQVGQTRRCLGTGAPVGELVVPLFEFARISMGRRSRRQLDGLAWPELSEADKDQWTSALVVWSVADRDIDDPVIDPPGGLAAT